MNNENPFDKEQEQNSENEQSTETAFEPEKPAEEQQAEPVINAGQAANEYSSADSQNGAEQAADNSGAQPTEPASQQNENREYNSQYTYHNANPQPKNYYTEQKHYIPTGFNNLNNGMNNQGGAYYNPNQQPQNNNNNANNGKKGLKIFIAIAVAVAVFVIGIGLGKIISDTTSNSKTTTSESGDDSLKYKGEDIEVNNGNAIERDDIKPDENGKYTADQVAELVGDSVVNIQVYSTTDSSAGATASGVILNDKGYIITNDHIYSSVTNAKFIVTMSDGTSYKASYVAGDQRSDIAVLKFDDMPKNLSAADFANSSDVKAGDDVIAIGSPFGLSGTVTKGIVSYPSRRITTSASSDENNNSNTASYSMRVIQTDVALNAGNSGGALVNMYGQVIGISSSKIAISGYEGLCFAIPANDAVKYAKSLVKNGAVANRAKLGITYTTNTSASSLLNNLPAGLIIQEISSESELYSKGITTGTNGDIITKINGKEITNNNVALDIIDDSSSGDEVELVIYSRSTKKEKTYKVKLLEDKSNTSYVNEIPKPSATNGFYDGNNGNGNSGNDSGSDYYKYYKSPFEFGE